MRAVFTLSRTASLGISMLSSLWLLGAVDPWLLLTPLCAVPTVILVPRSERYVDRARARAAESQRAATQIHQLFLAPGPAMELRVFDAAERMDERSDQLWREVSDVELGGAVRSALLASVGWLALTAGYVAALLYTAHLALEGRATVGDIVLVSQLALLIRGNVAQTAEAARQAAAALRTADRFLWLEDLHADQVARFAAEGSPPAALAARHRPRRRLLPLPRHRCPGAARRQPARPGRVDGRGGGRQRRRQDHAREAARRPLPTRRGHHLGRRHRPGHHRRRGVARPHERHVPGPPAARGPGPPDRRRG